MALNNRLAQPMPGQPAQGGFGSPWMPEAQLPRMSPQFMRSPRPMPGLQPMGGGERRGMDPRMMQALLSMFGRGQSLGGIPRFQAGGVVTQPTLGILGEEGPEAVVPLGGAQQPPELPQFGGWGRRFGGALPQGTPNQPNDLAGALQGLMQRFGATRGEGGTSYNWGVLNQAIVDANKARMFDPTFDPLMEQFRAQAFEDMGARQNAIRLGARLQGGGDPYLQAFAALQGQMAGQSDLSRMLGAGTLQRGTDRERFFQDLLRQAIAGQQGLQAAQAGQPGTDWGRLFGVVAGSAIGAAV